MNFSKRGFTEINMSDTKVEVQEESFSPDTFQVAGGNFSGVVKKLNLETSFEAERWFREKRDIRLLAVLWKTVYQFVKVYFVKGAWRCGFLGFMAAVNSSLYQLITYTKYWELTERERGRM